MIDDTTRAYLATAEFAIKHAKSSHIMHGNPAAHDIRYANSDMQQAFHIEGNLIVDVLTTIEALLKL